MYSGLFSFYEEFGATARAKNEALAARAAFVSGVMEQSYRLWLTLLTTEVTEAVRAAQDLSVCKNPAEVAEVQRAWFQASSARAITSLQGTIEISNFLIRNLQDTMNAMPAGTAAVTANPPPVVAAPVVAAPAVPAPAPIAAAPPVIAAAPTAAPAPAPTPAATDAVAAPGVAKTAKPAGRAKSNGSGAKTVRP